MNFIICTFTKRTLNAFTVAVTYAHCSLILLSTVSKNPNIFWVKCIKSKIEKYTNSKFNKNIHVYVYLHNPKLGIINPLKSDIHYIIQNNTLHTSQKTQCLHDKEQSNNAVQKNNCLL